LRDGVSAIEDKRRKDGRVEASPWFVRKIAELNGKSHDEP